MRLLRGQASIGWCVTWEAAMEPASTRVPVPAGTDRRLSRGDILDFGAGTHTATLTSDEAPSTSATSGETVVVGDGDLLAVPSVDDPIALIERDTDGRWVLTYGLLHTHVVDGQTIGLEEHDWKLSLPETLPQTATLSAVQHTVGDLALHFNVSADEEYVQVQVKTPTETVMLPARAHHYTLLVLARAWMNDSDTAAAERGWLYKADLERMLRLSGNHINLGIHRIRKELAGLGIADPEAIVERRLSTRQIRVGTSQISESPL